MCALAMGKPLITGRSAASQEILEHKENAYLIPFADSKALADAILTLFENSNLREKMGRNARLLFENKLTPHSIAKNILREIQKSL